MYIQDYPLVYEEPNFRTTVVFHHGTRGFSLHRVTEEDEPFMAICSWLFSSTTPRRWVAPDVPLIGYRAWAFTLNRDLVGRRSQLWDTPFMQARCLGSDGEYHTCGIYATLREGYPDNWSYAPALGLVSPGRGRVVIHGRGFRMASCIVRLLIVPDMYHIERFLARYPAWRETRILTYEQALDAMNHGIEASELMLPMPDIRVTRGHDLDDAWLQPIV
jgi:hypothetical protein